MRREYLSKTGGGESEYLDWLRTIGCKFYCEFDSSHGTVDLITNTELELTGYGSISYNSTYDAYDVTAPTQVNPVGYWNSNVSISDFTYNNVFSVIGVIQKLNNKYLPKINFCCSDTSDQANALNVVYNNTNNGNSYPSEVCYLGTRYDTPGGYRYYYQQGSLYGKFSLHNPYTPSNWYSSKPGFMLMYPYWLSSMKGASVRFYKYGIFNTLLDESTMNNILYHKL